jgi:hypothetical protein
MCRSKRQKKLLQQQELIDSNIAFSGQRLGCCGARKQRNLLRELEVCCQPSKVTQFQQQASFSSSIRSYHCPMAGILAVSIGLGAEKLGRKISEKRLERKEKKAAEVCFVLEFLVCHTKYRCRNERLSMDMVNLRLHMQRSMG